VTRSVDDLGRAVQLPAQVERIVSLVPSLTESVAATAAHLLVGATDYCTHPAGLAARRIGGTKNPDVAAVVALRPDLVLANEEENRETDLAQLRSAGLPVWVTAPRTVPEALASLRRMLSACGLAEPAWLRSAVTVWQGPPPVPNRRAFVPIWRRPWMSLGHGTFAGDLLGRLGVLNIHNDNPLRYPRVSLGELRGRPLDLVVLPDEPYRFTAADLDAFVGWPVRIAFVSGRHLTWYGPSLVEAREVLAGQLARAAPAPVQV